MLVGDDDTVVLSSPIILYDHPEVAPESDGPLYDATEIDEILALRVLTLTDEEKAEARATDPRAAAIVDRIDDMEPDVWARLHGTMRELRTPRSAPEPAGEEPPLPWWEPAVDAAVDPWTDTVVVAGVEVGTGTSVRLHPSRRADAHDMFFDGMVATVAGVFHDVDGEMHVAVTIDDDPATEALLAHGRYLFFHPDEVEPLRTWPPRTRAARREPHADAPDGSDRCMPLEPPLGRTDRRVLVAGIGNIFLGDDGFGVEVAQRLLTRPVPDGVRVEDFGIRGVHLAYELLDGYETLVLVDAVPMGEAPGTVALLEPEISELEPGDDPAPDPRGAQHEPGCRVRHARRPRREGRPHPDRGVRARDGRGGHRAVRRRRRLRRSRDRSGRRRARRVVSIGVPERGVANERGGEPMIRRLVLSAALAAIAVIIVKSLPDIARYLKIREM